MSCKCIEHHSEHTEPQNTHNRETYIKTVLSFMLKCFVFLLLVCFFISCCLTLVFKMSLEALDVKKHSILYNPCFFLEFFFFFYIAKIICLTVKCDYLPQIQKLILHYLMWFQWDDRQRKDRERGNHRMLLVWEQMRRNEKSLDWVTLNKGYCE